MALRNSQPLVWRPKGLSDAVDGTNAFPGAMASLSNLIPDPSTDDVWVPRPPAMLITNFPTFSSPGMISGALVVGDLVYGMVASARNAGHDEPFVFNLNSNGFVTVNGITSANTPTSPATTGDWTPPIIAQVGSRVIVTHPGFPGGQTKFGWFDISSFNATTTGDTVSGSPVITGNPELLGVQPGMTITGSGIPANTTVLFAASAFTAIAFTGNSHTSFTIDGIASTAGMLAGFAIVGSGIPPGTTLASVAANSVTLSQQAQSSVTGGTFYALSPSPSFAGYVSGTLTLGSPTITLGTTVGLWVGQGISGSGIPVGSTITAVVANTSITISQNATASGGQQFSVSGGVIVMSANATATANNVSVTIAGGTLAAPLWGAGDTQPNNLPSTPVGVAQMNGRAYYACGTDGIPFSDSGFPCQISDATRTQALTTSDGLAVTAIGPVTLASLVGGIVQSLIAFEGTSKMQQITGDPSTNNLSMNSLPVATGTLAPLSLAPCEHGLAFISPEGLRIVDFVGKISPPIGDHGQGIAAPFIYAVAPSRMCAAANTNAIRITVQNGLKTGSPLEEYWYHLSRKIWSGPHTSTAALIQPWGEEFVMTFSGTTGQLWVSQSIPVTSSSYIENGTQMIWQYEPVYLMPDNGDMVMNSLVWMTIASGGPSCSAVAPAEPLLYTAPVIGAAPVQPSSDQTGVALVPNQPPPPPEQPLPTPPSQTAANLSDFQAVAASSDGSIIVGGRFENMVPVWWFRDTGVRTDLAIPPGDSGSIPAVCCSDNGLIIGGFGGSWWNRLTGDFTQLPAALGGAIIRCCSSDGTIFVGEDNAGGSGSTADPVWWTNGHETGLQRPAGYSRWSGCFGCSLNAEIIVGYVHDASVHQHAAWWTLSGSPTVLNDAGIFDSLTTTAFKCSSDGTVIVGQVLVAAAQGQACWWDKATGSVHLLSFPNGTPAGTASAAYGVSGDGSTIVGVIFTSPGQTAVVWNRLGNTVSSLPLIAPTLTNANAQNISRDGTTIVGSASVPGFSLSAVWWSF